MFGISPEKGTSVLVKHEDWLFLDALLASKPEWTNLIELGTYYGLTSLYLGIIAGLRGGQVHTFDNIDQRKREIVKMWPDNIHFCHEDILKQSNGELVRWLRKPYTFAFLDNGNKPAEVCIYAKHLYPNSGFVAHNFGTEWTEWDIAYVVKEYGLSHYLWDLAHEMGTSCRAYIRQT